MKIFVNDIDERDFCAIVNNILRENGKDNSLHSKIMENLKNSRNLPQFFGKFGIKKSKKDAEKMFFEMKNR